MAASDHYEPGVYERVFVKNYRKRNGTASRCAAHVRAQRVRKVLLGDEDFYAFLDAMACGLDEASAAAAAKIALASAKRMALVKCRLWYQDYIKKAGRAKARVTTDPAEPAPAGLAPAEPVPPAGPAPP